MYTFENGKYSSIYENFCLMASTLKENKNITFQIYWKWPNTGGVLDILETKSKIKNIE